MAASGGCGDASGSGNGSGGGEPLFRHSSLPPRSPSSPSPASTVRENFVPNSLELLGGCDGALHLPAPLSPSPVSPLSPSAPSAPAQRSSLSPSPTGLEAPHSGIGSGPGNVVNASLLTHSPTNTTNPFLLADDHHTQMVSTSLNRQQHSQQHCRQQQGPHSSFATSSVPSSSSSSTTTSLPF